MSELAEGFASLPPAYRSALQLAQAQHNIEITLLQELVGGRTGAFLYLVSVSPADSPAVAHYILKLDSVHEKTTMDEIERHRLAQDQAPAGFARQCQPDIGPPRPIC